MAVTCMNRSYIIGGSILLVITVLMAIGTYIYLHTPRDAKQADARETLSSGAEQKFINLRGEEITFKEYEGTIRVVTTWASWNPFSPEELKMFDAVASTYKSKTDPVAFIAINRMETKEQAERFLSSLEPIENLVLSIDVNDTFYASIGGFAMPETVVYDRRGNIIEHFRGVATKEALIESIERAKSQE